MTTMFNLGGFGVQDKDPNLAEKIAKLKSGKKSSTQQVTDYLEHELGVDQRELPLTLKAAKKCAYDLMGVANPNCERMYIHGNSLGLTRIDLPDANVGSPDGCSVTEHSTRGTDWHEWKRVWVALVKNSEADGEPVYAFNCEVIYGDDGPVTVGPEPIRKIRNLDPLSYPAGTILRIQRSVIGEDGTDQLERHHVVVGGVIDDNGVTILKTMTPMNDVTGWSVIEEL